ncbi:MAG: hypothetical protein MUC36_26330 [Planctomycetes bacterium]|nr:hypothetical protein [Planctomycetota bacterium]
MRRHPSLCRSLVALPLLTAALPAQDPPPQQPNPRRAALERAAQRPVEPDQNLGSVPVAQTPGQGGSLTGPLTQLAISMDLMFAVGGSSERDASLLQLQGGQHDPRKRGFTLQQAEIQMNGAVDPYFRGQFVLVTSLDPDEGETIVEVEEAWLLTQQLPANLQLKAGHYLTEFGRLNQVHPHAWDFQDQPVVMTRFFGADGLRSPGARLSWLAPTPTYLEFFFGAQNANGETLQSFLANDEVYEERPIGGRTLSEEAREMRSAGDLLWHGRIATATDFSPAHTLGGGVSALFGPNATGAGADTVIYGADFMYRWRPVDNRRGYPFFKLQGEVMARAFDAAEQLDESDPLAPFTVPGETLDDWGGYLYGVYGFDVGWAFGLRAEYAAGSGGSYVGGGGFDRAQDPFRADRLRLSPMLSYQTSEFSRVRLQYNYDDSDHLDDQAHSVWLGFEILIGPHQPHTY